MGEFEELMEKRDKEYSDGNWKESIPFATAAISVAIQATALAQNGRAWGRRYVGYKTDDPQERETMYRLARQDWRAVLKTSTNIDTRISAIKGLMLLPEENIPELCELGIREIKLRIPEYQRRENIKAELLNSKGIDVRKTNPEDAERIFLNAYETVERGIVIAGHLINNAGVCHLILKNQAEDKGEKREHAEQAIKYLKMALKEYPEDQIEHRRAAQKKIDNTLMEIGNSFE
ncbi:hypothetical protein KAU51_01660 [Candidatus Parcubacteria bacterium]|nr:hypothetical protein [Candidatus Parcubacteria bacterium]